MKIVRAIFKKMKFFLCELPLILRVYRKKKKQAGDICKGILDIECERDWPVGLGATLGDATHRGKFSEFPGQNYFLPLTARIQN